MRTRFKRSSLIAWWTSSARPEAQRPWGGASGLVRQELYLQNTIHAYKYSTHQQTEPPNPPGQKPRQG